MPAIASETVLGQLQWRYATKKFDSTRKIPTEVWSQLEAALVLSPSSYGLQPWKFFVVTNPEVRAKLAPAAWNQPQITEASHLVVFAVKKGMNARDAEQLAQRTAEVRGVSLESLESFKNMVGGSLSGLSPEAVDAWMSRQVYIALGVFLSTAAMLEVDACPMEGFQPAQFDEILDLTTKGYSSVVLATAGYRCSEDKYASAAKVRFPASQVIEHIA